MSKQVLLCVETNKKSRTDYVYIVNTIKRFYVNDRKIVYKPIFLDSKTKYNAKDKVREINKYKNSYPNDTYVIYFIDVDDYDKSYETKILYDNINDFCQNNGYKLVFFTKDVEDVYLGHSVSDSEKVKSAGKFNNSKGIELVDETKLSVNCHRDHCSNILNILDKYWTRK